MKIVLAYPGGLDTSAIVSWPRETYDAQTVPVPPDIGPAEDTYAQSRQGLSR